MSDIHGQIDIFKTLLAKHAITDKTGNWIFNDGHLVITGDIFDRGDNVTEILWFLFELEQQAELSGGKLHLLLGNHEVMVLTNDLRYLSDKYLHVEKLLNQSMTELYAPTSILGTWLRSKNVVLKLNDMVFLHGGLHPELVDKSLSLADINQLFRLYLSEKSLSEVDKNIAEYLHGIDGPIWYRGYFNEEQPIGFAKLIAHFNVSKFIVGHTSQEQIETRYKDKVIAIDSSIKYGNNGEILLIEGDKFYRGLLNGQKIQLL
ncbi:metallophosphoesterase [Litorilituus lipolyticus]|uniref:metallophosphoesterase n=1 Tax=Litorilituus lipolyticus TaxID=2491017 RepID=UPI0024827632|nr:metallophosphoesterase [Litorilituus lipolyticus]